MGCTTQPRGVVMALRACASRPPPGLSHISQFTRFARLASLGKQLCVHRWIFPPHYAPRYRPTLRFGDTPLSKCSYMIQCPRCCIPHVKSICDCPICRFEEEAGSSQSTTSSQTTYYASQSSSASTSSMESNEENSEELLTYKDSSTSQMPRQDQLWLDYSQEHILTSEEEQLNKLSPIQKKTDCSLKGGFLPLIENSNKPIQSQKRKRNTEKSSNTQKLVTSNGLNTIIHTCGLQDVINCSQCE